MTMRHYKSGHKSNRVIGEALQRSAAAFSAANTDLNKSIALVTTANAVVQDPASVGTMFKTMSARIRGSATELAELGEEEDEFTKSTSKLQNLVKGLTGFDIMKDKNTYKDIYDIILGIGKEWKNLTDVEQASLTEALGGKRGVNTLSAVLNNVEGLEKAYATAQEAQGSAAREQENYAQSVQYSVDRAKASLQQLSVDFLSSDFLKGAIEAANTFLKLLDQIVNKIGTLPALFGTLGLIDLGKGLADPQKGSFVLGLGKAIVNSFKLANYTKMGKDIRGQIENVLKESGGQIIKEGTAIIPTANDITDIVSRNLTEAGASSAIAAKAAGASAGTGFLSGLSSVLTVGAIGAIIVGGGLIAISAYEKHLSELREGAKEGFSEWNSDNTSISSQIADYSALKEAIDSGNLSEQETYEKKKQIYAIQQSINEAYGGAAGNVDLVNGKLSTQLSTLQQIQAVEAERNLRENADKYEQIEKDASSRGTSFLDVNSISALGAAQRSGLSQGLFGNQYQLVASGTYEEQQEAISKYVDDLKEIQKGLSTTSDEYDKVGKDITAAEKLLDNSYWKTLDSQMETKTTMEIYSARNKLTGLVDGGGVKAVTDLTNAISSYNEAVAIGDPEKVEESREALEKAIKTKDDFLEGYEVDEKEFSNYFDNIINTLNADAVRQYDFSEIIGAALSTDRNKKEISEDNQFTESQRKNISGLSEELVGLKLTALDAKLAFDKSKRAFGTGYVGSLNDVERAVYELGVQWGLTSKSTQNDIDAFVDAMTKMGVFTDAFDSGASKYNPDISAFRTSMQSRFTNIDNINAALASSASGKGLSMTYDETGTLTGDVANLQKAFKDLKKYNSATLFRKTSMGIKLNTKELNKLQKQQEQITRQEFYEKQKDLAEQLANAEAERIKALQDNQDVRGLDSQIDALKNSLNEVQLLKDAYDGVTNAYQKWVDAQSAGEEGDIYDNIQKTALTRGDELLKAGLVGTNEFRAIAELFSGQDLTGASAAKVVEAYQSIDQVIPGTDKKIRDFFVDGIEGADNFALAMTQVKDKNGEAFAELKDGSVYFKNMNTGDLAEAMGTSTEIVESILQKMKDYGDEISWFTPEQGEELKKINATLDETRQKYADVDLSRFGNFDVDSLNDIESLDYEIGHIQTLLAHQTDANINTDEARLLEAILQACIDKKQVLAEPIQMDVSRAAYEQGSAALTEAESMVQTWREMSEKNPEIEFSIDTLKGDQELMTQLDTLVNQHPEIKASLGIDANANTLSLLQAIMDGTLGQKAAAVAYKGSRAGMPSSVESKVSKNTTENDVVNKTTDIRNTEENRKVTVTESGAPETSAALQGVADAANSIPESKETTVNTTTDTKPLEETEDKVNEVDGKTMSTYVRVDPTELSTVESRIENFRGTLNATTSVDTTELDNAMNRSYQTKYLYYKWVPTNTLPEGAHGVLNGTAHASGSAFGGRSYAHGNWGLPSKQTALTGELGPEIVVNPNTGTWQTVGDNGAEFVDLPKGAIVFNHLQSEQLLKNGYTHGRAHASGTAFASSTTGSHKIGGVKKKNDSGNNNGGGGGNNNGGNNNSSKPAKTTTTKKQKAKVQKKDFDWIEKLLDYFNRTFENFKSLGEYYTTFYHQNKSIDSAISAARDLIKANKDAGKKYNSKATSTLKSATTTNSKGKKTYFFGKNGTGKYKGKTVDQYIKLLNEGKLDFTKYNADFISALEEASGFLDKATECKQQVNELNKEIYELSKQKLDNIVDDYDHIIDKLESANSLLEAQNKLIERRTKGKADLKYFNTVQGLQIKNLQDQAAIQNKIVDAAKAEYADYQAQLNKNIREGKFVNNGEAQHEALTKLNEIREAAVNAELQVYEINDAIRELNWQNFKNGISMLDHLGTQLESTLSLFSDLTTFSDDGSITKAGVSQMNLYASQLANSRQKIAEYMNAIEVLREEEKNQNIDQKAVREELMETQESLLAAANDTKKYRDAILSLIKDGINKETEAMSKLIDKQKESLRRRKEENDYAKQVRDSQKEINELRRQEAALVGDTTQSANAQRIKLQADIRKKEEELAEKQRDHQYDMEVQGLDDLNTKFSENQEARIKELEASLEAQSKAIDNALIYTHGRYKETSDLLTSLTKEYGIEFESDVLKPWQSASDALVNYARATTPLDEVKGKLESLSATYNGLGNKVTPVFDETGINSLLAKLREAVAAVGKLGTTEIKTGGYVDPHSSDGTNKPQKEAEDMLGKQSSGSTKKEETKQTGTWTVADTKKVGQITKVTPDGKTVTATKTAVLLTTSGNTAPKLPATQTAKTHPTLAVDAKTVQSQGLAAALNKAVTDQAKKDAEAKKAAESKKAAEAAAKAKKDAENKKIKDIINSGATHKKSVSKEEAKKHVALWEHIAKTYGRTATNDMYKKIAGVLGIKVDATPTSAQKNSILSALKARGLVGGAYRVSSGGWHLTDEEGVGSEAILTKEGVLRQLDAKDTVFNAKQREQLWNLSKMDLSSLTDLPKGSIGGNVTMHYDSLLTVNGNVDDSTLPKLQELLKMASEYTQKDMKKGLMKLGHN